MTPISAHLSERKALGENGKIAVDFSSELTIDGKLRQKVTDEELLMLTIRGYPYIDIITLQDNGQNTQEICNYSNDGLIEKFIIQENMHKNRNENRYIISRKISRQSGDKTEFLNTEDIAIKHSWDTRKEKGETIININYSDSTDRIIGDEEIEIANRKIEYSILNTEIEELSNFIDPENKGFERFFSSFAETVNSHEGKEPEEIYMKQIQKYRNSKDDSLKELLKNLDSAPIYPFENTCNLSRKYGVLEFGYQEGNTRKYIKAIAFSPSEKTGNEPVYMIIKEDIKTEDGIEYVEKDFFIDSNMTAILKHLV